MCGTPPAPCQCPTSPGFPRPHHCQQQDWGEAARGCTLSSGRRNKEKSPSSPLCASPWHSTALLPRQDSEVAFTALHSIYSSWAVEQKPCPVTPEDPHACVGELWLLSALQGVYHRLRALLWGFWCPVVYLRYPEVRAGNPHEGKAQVVNICFFSLQSAYSAHFHVNTLQSVFSMLRVW